MLATRRFLSWRGRDRTCNLLIQRELPPVGTRASFSLLVASFRIRASESSKVRTTCDSLRPLSTRLLGGFWVAEGGGGLLRTSALPKRERTC
jgi:hypothetical protein